jgi:hypothetical protein
LLCEPTRTPDMVKTFTGRPVSRPASARSRAEILLSPASTSYTLARRLSCEWPSSTAAAGASLVSSAVSTRPKSKPRAACGGAPPVGPVHLYRAVSCLDTARQHSRRSVRLDLLPRRQVMQVENDYDKEVYNGDLGVVSRIRHGEGRACRRLRRPRSHLRLWRTR